MKRSFFCIITTAILAFALAGTVAGTPQLHAAESKTQTIDAASEKSDGGRILFISSYGYGWDTVQLQIEGIQSAVGEHTVVDYEFMDTKRVSDEASYELFYEGMKYRLQNSEPYDVIILGDDAALSFAQEYQDELFDGIPLVFEGINNESLALTMATDPLVTGVLEKLSVEKNIDFAKSLLPDATRVVAILDDSVTGEAERERFFSYQSEYPNLKFSEINSSEFSTSVLGSKIEQIGKSSILIYITMTEDADGKHYSDSEAISFITQYAHVPVFRMVEAGIGDGLLGGNVVSMTQSGAIAAEIAMDIISGTDSGEINVVLESPNVYCVDELVMKKYKLDMDALPEDTVIVNYQATFLERNREAILPVAILIGMMLIILGISLVDNMRRRRLYRELEETRKIIENASHHDFLTSIPNRSKMMEDLEELIRTEVPCTILMIDIDEFKKINDTYGHTAGDDALKELAARMRAIHSQILVPYRFAGDEFIMILKSVSNSLVEKTAYQTRELFAKPFMLAGEKHKVCGSIGIASFPKDAKGLEELIECADHAMYTVKKSGKNNFAFYEPRSEADAKASEMES